MITLTRHRQVSTSPETVESGKHDTENGNSNEFSFLIIYYSVLRWVQILELRGEGQLRGWRHGMELSHSIGNPCVEINTIHFHIQLCVMFA